jgi:hydrogenase 3 maturation protease
VELARRLAGKVPWKVYNAQTAPESFLVKVADQRPETVILVDAMDFGGQAGEVQIFEAEQTEAYGPSTHGPGAGAFFRALRLVHPCRCLVLGVQPFGAKVGDHLSEPVCLSVDRIEEAILRIARE